MNRLKDTISNGIGLDTVLEGTPLPFRQFQEKLMQHAYSEDAQKELDLLFEERFHRRANPQNLAEACRLNNLSYVIMHWASPSRKNKEKVLNEPVFMAGLWATPLMWAAREGHEGIVRFLLDHGADPSVITTDEGSTALHWAIIGGNAKIVRHLLNHEKTDPNQKNIHLCDAPCTAIAHRKLFLFWMIVEDAFLNTSDLSATPGTSSSIGELSSSAGGELCISSGLRRSLTVCQKDSIAFTHSDVVLGHEEGGNKNGNEDERERRNTTLVETEGGGGSGDGDKDGCTVSSNPRVERRIFHQMNPQQTTVTGHTYLHYAAWGGMMSACQYLVERWNFDVNAKDNQSRTPLIWASREGHTHVIEYFLSVGADAFHTDLEGHTAVYYARTRAHPEAAKALDSLRFSSPYVSVSPPQHQSNNNSNNVNSIHSIYSAIETDVLGGGGGGGRDGERNGHCNRLSHWEHPSVQHSPHSPSYSSVFLPRYCPCRQVRAFGTFASLASPHAPPAFRCMALFAVAVFFLLLFCTRLIPPMVSYLALGLYFFRNYLFLWWHGIPVHLDGLNKTSVDESVGSSIAKLFQGTWATRYRNPGNMIMLSLVLLFQCYAWTQMGLPPLLWFSAPSGVDGARTGSLFLEGNSTVWQHPSNSSEKEVQPVRPSGAPVPISHAVSFHSLFGGCFFQIFFSSPDAMASFLLSAMVVSIFLLMVAVKWHRGVDVASRRPNRGGDGGGEWQHWSKSPFWKILKMGSFEYAHPRAVDAERHWAIPLRTFYCPEQDIYVRRYDGYSILLDCPISKCNKRAFVLLVTVLAVQQWCMWMWGLSYANAIMFPHGVPSHEPMPWSFRVVTQGVRHAWSGGDGIPRDSAPASLSSFPPFSQSPLSTTPFSFSSDWSNLSSSAASATTTAEITSTLSPSSMDPMFHLSLSLLFSAPLHCLALLWNMYFHALPFRQTSFLISQSSSSSSFPSRLLFWYFIPSSSSFYGMWVFQLSFCACVLFTVVMVRQWCSVWYGASRMEITNPVAMREDGKLVSIFLPSRGSRGRNHRNDNNNIDYNHYNPEEEEYYRKKVGHSVARIFPPPDATHCIYSNTSNRFANVLLFFLGLDGRRWEKSFHISFSHSPIYSPAFQFEELPTWAKVLRNTPPNWGQVNETKSPEKGESQEGRKSAGALANKYLV